MGDILLAVVGLAKQYKLNPEAALRQANNRFTQQLQAFKANAK